MGWYGNYCIEYTGDNPYLFENVAKIYIPNYKERFVSTIIDDHCFLNCKRNLSWYTSNFDIKTIMKYMPNNSSCLMTIDGETHPRVNEVFASEFDHDSSDVIIDIRDKDGHTAQLEINEENYSVISRKDDTEFSNKLFKLLDVIPNSDPGVHINEIISEIEKYGFIIENSAVNWYYGDSYYGYKESKYDELSEEIILFKKEKDEVIVQNDNPDIDRYIVDCLGLNQMLSEQADLYYEYSDDLTDWLSFVKENVDISDNYIMEIFIDAVKEATNISESDYNIDRCNKDELKKYDSIREIFSDINKAREYMNHVVNNLEIKDSSIDDFDIEPNE